MQFQVLTADYDGTLATDGIVDEKTVAALQRLRDSGRRLILVTGRIMPQLLQVFPQLDLCDLVVSDNGAVLFDPKTGQKNSLAERPPKEFMDELTRRGVPPVEVGDVVVATWEPHEATVLQVIHDLGLARKLSSTSSRYSMASLSFAMNEKKSLASATPCPATSALHSAVAY